MHSALIAGRLALLSALLIPVIRPCTIEMPLPSDQELVFSWAQFPAGASGAIQYTVVDSAGSTWMPDWGSTASHGQGQSGPATFVDIRAAKTPYESVRVAVRNGGQERSYTLIAHNDSAGPIAWFRGGRGLPHPITSLAGQVMLAVQILPQQEGGLLRLTLPDASAHDGLRWVKDVALAGMAEATLAWSQYPPGIVGAAQYDAWIGADHWAPPWGTTESHGAGLWGPAPFASLHVSKDPYSEVRVGVSASVPCSYVLSGHGDCSTPFPVRINGQASHLRLVSANGPGLFGLEVFDDADGRYLRIQAREHDALLPAGQTLDFSPPATVAYGASVTLSATASSGLAPAFRVVSGPGALVGGVLSAVGGGSIVVEAIQVGDAQVAPAAPVQRAISVTPAVLSIQADNQAASFGGAIPSLSWQASGLANGDDVGIITGSLACGASLGSPAGTYPITQGSLTAGPNYHISFTGADLVIGPAAASISLGGLLAVYDGAPHAVTVTTVPAGLATLVTYGGSSTQAPVEPGTYQVQATVIQPSYQAVSATGVLVIRCLPQIVLPPAWEGGKGGCGNGSGLALALGGLLALGWRLRRRR